MTEDELRALIDSKDPQKLVEALSTLDEKQRRKLSKLAQSLYKPKLDESEARMQYRGPESHKRVDREGMFVCTLALLALAPFAKAKQALRNLWLAQNYNKLYGYVCKVLEDRRPDWLDKWVSYALSHDFNIWAIIRRLIMSGVASKPANDEYIIMMFRLKLGHDSRTLKERLLDDKELFKDEIWRLFALAAMPQAFFSPDDDPVYVEYSWSHTLIELANEGHIDRKRLLTESVKALTVGPRKSNTKWFYSLHERLKPTFDERVSLQDIYLDLLKSSTPAVVAFALKALKEIYVGKGLKCEKLLHKIADVFNVETKGPAIVALKLLKNIASEDLSMSVIASEKMCHAFTHRNIDVHLLALDLISRNSPIPPTVDKLLRQYIDGVSASVQCKIHGLIGIDEKNVEVRASDEYKENLDLLKSAPLRYQEYVKAEALLNSYEGEFRLEPVSFSAYDVPRLASREPLTPISDLDELIERLTVFLETGKEVDEFELIIDGMSQLCDQRPKDLRQRTEPLLKRSAGRGGRLEALNYLFYSWADTSRIAKKYFGNRDSTFTWQRVLELSKRLVNKQAAPMLACPTHQGGWVCPQIFAKRLDQLLKAQEEIPKFDLIQAILRLAPEGRQDVIAKLKTKVLIEDEYIEPEDKIRLRWSLASPHTVFELHHSKYLRLIDTPASDPIVQRWVKEFHPSGFITPNDLAIRCVDNVWPANADATFSFGAAKILFYLDGAASTWDSKVAYFDRLFDPDQLFSKPARYLVLASLMAKDGDVRGLAIDALIDAISDGRVTGQHLGKDLREFFKHKVVKANRFAEGLVAVSRQSVLHTYVCSEILQVALAEQRRLPQNAHHILQCLLEWLIELKAPVSEGVRETLSQVDGISKTAKLAKRLLARTVRWSDEIRAAVLDEALVGRCERIKRWLG
jgi:hypothetical protein